MQYFKHTRKTESYYKPPYGNCPCFTSTFSGLNEDRRMLRVEDLFEALAIKTFNSCIQDSSSLLISIVALSCSA